MGKFSMKKSNLLAIFALFLTAAIWGLSYSAQSEAMKSMPPLWFVCVRYLIGSAVLLPVIFYQRQKPHKQLLSGGIICGFFLAGGEILQQIGLLYTTAGKAGFLTALYVIMIPVIGVLFKKKSTTKIWAASLLSVAGAYLLCSDGTLKSFGNAGDILMLICALFFAFQFISLAKFAPQSDALQLAAVQFFTVAILSGIAALIGGEDLTCRNITGCWLPLFYCGVIAIGFACTIQVAVQKCVHPATTAIILSTASVFAVIWGWGLLHESYSRFSAEPFGFVLPWLLCSPLLALFCV